MLLHLLPHPSAALTLFAHICDGLRAAIGPRTTAATPAGRFYIFLVGYILRASRRIDALFAKWRAGTLPPIRARKPRATPARPAAFRLPQGKLWLIKRVPQAASAAAYDGLRVMHDDPEFQAFLREVPRAARLLRPFYTAVDFPPPGAAPKPRRIRKPRPKAPKPEPPRWGKYTPRQLRNYSPGKIPDPIRRPAGTQKRPPR